ncbi:protein-tyrosine kinase 6b [Alosa sapidissima]|uniref:protein-tyrosine kinase 6b n=1 Tax=Alosa sapidissima TaxID=34773 RepID=UPI001C083D03|nr:protein-tyrosine kinase 6b [Alosa sapidissima]
MGETARKVCPCLEALWTRMFGKSADSGDRSSKEEDGLDARTIDNPMTSTSRYTSHSFNGVSRPSHGPESGIYRALWSFEARAEDELSFNGGDLFKVINRKGEWWTAQKIDRNGRTLATGIVPYNYLASGETDDAQPWFYGKMSRVDALSHLMSPNNSEGTFLIRLSEACNGGHVLSVKVDNRAKHFKIYQTNGKFHLDPSRSFSTLQDLVEHYKTHCLAAVDCLGQACIRKEPTPQDLSHSTVDEWELPKEEFTLEHRLGVGFFAEVYRGKWKNRISVAIKILKNNEYLNQQEFHQEVQILKKLRHRHLISLFAICTSSEPFYIITEFMEKGNLLDFLRGPEGRALDQVCLVDMAAQVADGMSYLELQNSIHRDLAARNVLVGENYICKVADFGLARIIKEPFYVSENKKIPYKWCAPEAISHGRFSSKSDIWSFGILLHEIMSYGGVPYPGYQTNEVYDHVMKGYRMPQPVKCPKYIYDIMLSCWSVNPDDRPSFKDLKPDLENVNRYELA